ncbi:MAG TPA: gephyrin-like molybdotransferase Glp [Myxococcales bacterium]|jgi:molybdopterin molybdotransferase|nr:gephyrin-like molybdotransferase Glp [Myxococcales bacterium]
MIPLDEALAAVRARSLPLPQEEVPLVQAAGRVLSRPVLALRDQPATDVSMMDGYALRADDGGAPLQVVMEVAAGDAPRHLPLGVGEAARIFTGAPIPRGADCVVMQENCLREGDSVRVQIPAKAGMHVRKQGEELRAGLSALPRGTRLRAAELSLCAACGQSSVFAHRRPRVALLSTGSELVPLGEPPGPGKLIETNSLALRALCAEAGADVTWLGIVQDDVAAIAGRLHGVDADVVLTTGGASVGDHDHARASLQALGVELIFHTVAIRPGKPVLFGAGGGRLFFGLPGNPAAATLGFELFVRLALRLLVDDPNPARTQARARLRGTISRVPKQTYFPRGRASLEGAQLMFVPGGQQSSMHIASWAFANAVAVVPPGDGRLDDGTEVDVLLTGPLD